MQQIFRLPDVKLFSGLGRSSIYAEIKAHRFPPPVRIAPRAVGWTRESLETWLNEQIERSRGNANTEAQP